MRPALESGDWVLARRRRLLPERGDVVVLTVPEARDRFLIKRVVGLPGELVSIADGQVHVDGMTLAEPWANGPTFPEGDHEVGGDSVWVVGDNRGLSTQDSRTIGPVPISDVEWVAFAIYWPASRIGFV
jgi:signal peptidase I